MDSGLYFANSNNKSLTLDLPQASLRKISVSRILKLELGLIVIQSICWAGGELMMMAGNN